MRKSILTTLFITTSLTATSIWANDEGQDYQHAAGIGMGTGVVIGAIVAGPVGATVAGVLGAMLGNDVRQDKMLASSQRRLSLQASLLSERDEALLAMRNQLQKQQRGAVTHVAVQTMHDIPFLSLQSSVQFETGAHSIAPDYMQQLDLIAKTLKGYPSLTARLTGHADQRGNDEYNQALSMQRAISVKQYLVDQGVDTKQVLTVALGESESAHISTEKAFFDRKVVIELGSKDTTLTAKR